MEINRTHAIVPGVILWIMFVILVGTHFTRLSPKSSTGDRPPLDSVLNRALSPRTLFVRPTRALIIQYGQMIVWIARNPSNPVPFHVRGSTFHLPFKTESFEWIALDAVFVDRAIARELWRVAGRWRFGILPPYAEAHIPMIRAGWKLIERHGQYNVYQKVMISA